MPAVCFGGKPPHFVPKTAIFLGLRDFFVPFCPVSRSFSASIFPICRKAAVIPPEMRQPLAVHRRKTPNFATKNPDFSQKTPRFSPMPRRFPSRTPAFCLLSVRRRIEVPHGCVHSLRMESAKQATKCHRSVCNAEKARAGLHFVRATCCYS